MISTVRGAITALGSDYVVVEVGGVGLLVHVTPNALRNLHLGAQTHLATSLVVREDSLTLFGFHDDDERVLFELLQYELQLPLKISRLLSWSQGSVAKVRRESAWS
jgi:Holliday junction DNA helicase RuvA